MVNIRYVCEGGCQTKVTAEEFKKGKSKCTVSSCPNKGKPLIRKEYCPHCNTVYDEGEDHLCV